MSLRYLNPGTVGPEVKALQTALNARQGEQLVVDGIYGQKTIDAVKRAQVRIRQPVNGFASIIDQQKLNVQPWVEPPVVHEVVAEMEPDGEMKIKHKK